MARRVEEDSGSGFAVAMLIFMLVIVVGGLMISYKRGDISSPKCGGFSGRVQKK